MKDVELKYLDGSRHTITLDDEIVDKGVIIRQDTRYTSGNRVFVYQPERKVVRVPVFNEVSIYWLSGKLPGE